MLIRKVFKQDLERRSPATKYASSISSAIIPALGMDLWVAYQEPTDSVAPSLSRLDKYTTVSAHNRLG